MLANAAAENALGTAGTICWTVQLLPQIWKSWRDKSTEGLSAWLTFLWGIAGCPLGVYNTTQDLSIPLMIQPQLFGFLCIVSWGQCLYYGQRKPAWLAALIGFSVMTLMAGIEAGCIFALRPRYDAGSESAARGVTFFGILSAMIISLALFPQYWEIYKHKEVIGVSILFIFIDWMGGLLSFLSIAFMDKWDVLASVTYGAVVLLDGLILLAALILNPPAHRRRKREAATSESRLGMRERDAPRSNAASTTISLSHDSSDSP